MVNNWKLKCQHHGLQVHCKRLEVLKKRTLWGPLNFFAGGYFREGECFW